MEGHYDPDQPYTPDEWEHRRLDDAQYVAYADVLASPEFLAYNVALQTRLRTNDSVERARLRVQEQALLTVSWETPAYRTWEQLEGARRILYQKLDAIPDAHILWGIVLIRGDAQHERGCRY